MPKINWDYKKVMEGMSDEELTTRIKEVMKLELDNKVRPIPFCGDSKEIVTYTCDELISRCPVTGYPDINRITIKMIPGLYVPELKSLKFYFMEYMDIPISHENLVAKIYLYLGTLLQPEAFYVKLEVNIRGGVITTCEAGKEPK